MTNTLPGWVAGGVVVVAACAAMACRGDFVCTLEPKPDAVVVELRTSSGAPAALGATAFAQDGAYMDTTGPLVGVTSSPHGGDSSHIGLANARGGNYTVRVTKPNWTTPPSKQVSVNGATCGRITSKSITMTLDPSPGAPPVRGIAIAPREVHVSFCGGSGPVQWYVDADPGVSTAVSWESTDTTVVKVSQGGVVTIRSKGTALVVARSIAFPQITGSAVVRVDPVCP